MRLGNRASANKVAGAAELMVGSLGCGGWVSKHVFEVLPHVQSVESPWDLALVA